MYFALRSVQIQFDIVLKNTINCSLKESYTLNQGFLIKNLTCLKWLIDCIWFNAVWTTFLPSNSSLMWCTTSVVQCVGCPYMIRNCVFIWYQVYMIAEIFILYIMYSFFQISSNHVLLITRKKLHSNKWSSSLETDLSNWIEPHAKPVDGHGSL